LVSLLFVLAFAADWRRTLPISPFAIGSKPMRACSRIFAATKG